MRSGCSNYVSSCAESDIIKGGLDMNVFITGAAGGLGRALANECGRRGYNIFLTDINEKGINALKRGLERQYGVCVASKVCDLTDP